MKVKGFSSVSSLAMVTVADCGPVAEAEKLTSNVTVLPPGATVAVSGCLVTLKAVLPLMATRGEPVRARDTGPVLVMVKVCAMGDPPAATLPKSVLSSAPGVASPLAMFSPLPFTAISGLPRR